MAATADAVGATGAYCTASAAVPTNVLTQSAHDSWRSSQRGATDASIDAPSIPSKKQV